MNASELQIKLFAEGCNPANFSVLGRGDDMLCLDEKGGKWSIFYSERGCDSEPIFTSDNEEEACKIFFNYVVKQQHWHIVGFFKNESDAVELEDKLVAIGIKPIRNDIPAYKTANDPRYRVFVVGKEIFKVRECLGHVNIRHT
ncbi:SPOR domain-containing protein [Aeromonas simiae]|uniref:SPOR domain-containing protein n=1 Tax=Aeromonas simiae TaxID=218936 RepID=UPI0038CF47E5